MSPQVLAYPFLFIAIFFESFVLVTFLSEPARKARARTPRGVYPSVAIIVPCYNEESTIAATCESLLALDYPADKLELVLVDDGSTDGTPAAMARFADNPRVKVIRKENGGKHTALNVGIAATSAEFIGCLDADSFVEPDALKELIDTFEDPQVAATTAAMTVHEPKNLIEHMQSAEYTFGVTLRHALAAVNGLYVTPGPFSFYRRSVVEELGGFREGHKTEDMEMALRIQRAGYRIENAPRARVYTKAPRSLLRLVKQRTRWTTGFMRNMRYDYHDLIGRRRYGALGTLVLPIGLIALLGGMLLFGLALYELLAHAASAFALRAGVPLAYAYLPRWTGFDWFYLPSSLYLLLGAATILASVTMIVIGKRLSNAPQPLLLGIISYVLFYGLVAPLWVIRAATDVALGTERRWK